MFLAEAACRAAGAGLPEFVEQEFREFLTCGVLAHGFARVQSGHLRVRVAGAVLVEGAWILSELRRPADDGAGGAPGD